MQRSIVDIYGGIGNQIFQYAFARNLEQQGQNVFISTRYNEVVMNRDVISRKTILNPQSFGFRPLRTTDKLFFNFFDSSFIKSFDSSKRIQRLLNKHVIWHNERTFSIKNLKKLNRITGHWQNFDLILNNKDYLKTSLKNTVSFTNKGSSKDVDNNTFALHVRRGDYISLGRNLSESYYSKALDILRSEEEDFKFQVFSDDINWAKNNPLFKSADIFHDYEDGEYSNLRDFERLLTFKNYIISNSTFSLLPALFNSSEIGRVIYPKDWKRDEFAKIKNRNWVGI